MLRFLSAPDFSFRFEMTILLLFQNFYFGTGLLRNFVSIREPKQSFYDKSDAYVDAYWQLPAGVW